MCCCGLEISRRQWLWTTLMATVASAVAGRAWGQEPSAAALQVLKEYPSVDVHSHGGSKGITSKEAPNASIATAMRAGGLAAVCLADVPDGPLLGRDPQGVLRALRPASEGELYQFHLKRLDWVDQLVAEHGLRRALTLADLRAAHAAEQPALVQDIEGLDFLEGKLERIGESQRRGVRHVQLVHYTPNAIGDFQTGEVRHHGLTPFGAEVVRECNRLGLVIDVAHATEDTVIQAARVASKPLLLSHTALQGSPAMGKTPLAGRQISPAHAKAVAATGGAVGLWHFFPSLQRYVDGIKEMVDVVGVEHVCIGTDQQVAVGILQDYGHLPKLADLLLQGGFSAADAGAILGGNYLRIFAASTGAA